MNGVIIDEYYEEKVLESMKSKPSVKCLDNKTNDEHTDNKFVFIAGYTPGGAPYGIIHEEIFSDENGNKLNDVNITSPKKVK